MRNSDFKEDIKKDKIEITKQQQAKIQRVFAERIIPSKNHVLFEINLKEKTIIRAEFKPPNTMVHWVEALELYKNRVIKKVNIFNPDTVTKSEVVKRENCIYISAMNKENAIKILKRVYNISL